MFITLSIIVTVVLGLIAGYFLMPSMVLSITGIAFITLVYQYHSSPRRYSVEKSQTRMVLLVIFSVLFLIPMWAAFVYAEWHAIVSEFEAWQGTIWAFFLSQFIRYPAI